MNGFPLLVTIFFTIPGWKNECLYIHIYTDVYVDVHKHMIWHSKVLTEKFRDTEPVER